MRIGRVAVVMLAGAVAVAACSDKTNVQSSDTTTSTKVTDTADQGSAATTTTGATTTTSAPVTTPKATKPPTTAAPTQPPTTPKPTKAPTTTAPAHQLYDEVKAPKVPTEHTDPFLSDGVLDDGYYWVVYNGGETQTPDITVYEAYFGAACEQKAQENGEECDNDIYVPQDPSRDISDLPFAKNVYLTVADGQTQKSYWITPDELRTIRASSPSDGAPADFSFTPFPFLMTVKNGKITKFEQLWTP